MNGQPRLTLTLPILVFTGEAATIIAAITRVVAITTLRATATTALPAGPLYICNAERLTAMHFKGTRT